jgi:PS-10 peptidase S37
MSKSPSYGSFLKILTVVKCLSLLSVAAVAQYSSEVTQKLSSIPGAELKVITGSKVYKQYYLLKVRQPIDHDRPEGPSFQQRVFIGMRDTLAPTIMETEGYAADRGMAPGYQTELAALLNGNQVLIEHRYFSESVPDSAVFDWKYLTVAQATADYHQVREWLRDVFKGKWLSTGISKGGQMATAYRVLYPNDVDVTVPYVAPLNLAKFDKRIEAHFRTVGTPEVRQKLKDFQFYLLKHKKELLPLMEKKILKTGVKFDPFDVETVFDYEVLEFPFSFWQWGHKADRIPLGDTVYARVVDYLENIVGSSNYIKEGYAGFIPAFYMFYREMGYYEYYEKAYRPYLKQKDYPNSVFAPDGKKIAFDMGYIKKLKKFIRNGGADRMIYIYGEVDPWSATQIMFNGKKDNLKMIAAGGSHFSRIRQLSPEQREQVYQSLERWLGMTLDRTKIKP